jgi:hypothetical protein
VSFFLSLWSFRIVISIISKETLLNNLPVRVKMKSREGWFVHVESGSWRGTGRQAFLVLLRWPNGPSKE